MRRVAIVIVAWNSSAVIGGCLDAVAGLSDVETIVIDNASADGTREEVARRGVRLIANPTNAGFAAAVNQGVEATTAPLVLLLNPDAYLVRGLDALAACFDRPDVGVAGGMLTGADGNPQTGFMARNLPAPITLIFEALGINRLFPDNSVNWHYRCKGLNPMTAAFVEQPAGAFFMFSRSVWLRVGGFDERFRPVWFEDVDFCAKVKAAGLKACYEPGAVANHTGSHSIRALSLENREHYWYGSLLEYAAKQYRPAVFRTICAAVVAGSVFRIPREIPRMGVRSFPLYGRVAGLALSRLFRPRKAPG